MEVKRRAEAGWVRLRFSRRRVGRGKGLGEEMVVVLGSLGVVSLGGWIGMGDWVADGASDGREMGGSRMVVGLGAGVCS